MEPAALRLVFALAGSTTFVRVAEPSQLASVPAHAEGLSLENLEVGDEVLSALPIFSALRCLDLDGTAISDDALTWVAQQASLEELWLECTGVTDAGLVHLHALTRLAFVSLAYTEVTQAGVAALRAAMPRVEVSPP
jgi:hypothetical protein